MIYKLIANNMNKFGFGLMLLLIIIGAIVPYLFIFLLIVTVIITYFMPPEKIEHKPKKIYNHSLIQMKKEYLASYAWELKRKERLKLDNFQCKVCLNKTALEVHHLHYRTLGNESMDDLVTVCRTCHQAIHDKYGYDHTKTFPLPINVDNLQI